MQYVNYNIDLEDSEDESDNLEDSEDESDKAKEKKLLKKHEEKNLKEKDWAGEDPLKNMIAVASSAERSLKRTGVYPGVYPESDSLTFEKYFRAYTTSPEYLARKRIRGEDINQGALQLVPLPEQSGLQKEEESCRSVSPLLPLVPPEQSGIQTVVDISQFVSPAPSEPSEDTEGSYQ